MQMVVIMHSDLYAGRVHKDLPWGRIKCFQAIQKCGSLVYFQVPPFFILLCKGKLEWVFGVLFCIWSENL